MIFTMVFTQNSYKVFGAVIKSIKGCDIIMLGET